jgi:hypothetical protein
LNVGWSTRRAHIQVRQEELAIAFQHDHGRPPTPIEALHLAQQATLETRDAKHEPRSLAEQRATWQAEAEQVLGGRDAVTAMVGKALTPTAGTRVPRGRRVGFPDRRAGVGCNGGTPLHLADVACPSRSPTPRPHR